MGLKIGWERKKKKNEKKTTNETEEKAPENNELAEIGLMPSKPSAGISIHGENGMYISNANIAEIKRTYGTIQEYLKQRFGPGKYTVTVKGKSGEETQHISIAGDEPSLFSTENPPGVDHSMGIYLSLQAENARLKAEMDSLRNAQQTSTLGQFITPAIDFVKTMMQSRPDTDLASVMTAATECLKTLSEIKTPGEKSDIGGLMSGVAQLIQGYQSQRPVGQMQPPPAYVSSPTPPMVMQPPTFVPQTHSVVPTPPPQAAPTAQNVPNSMNETNNETDVFFENLIGMTEQKQSPKVVAEYIVQSVQKISPHEIQDPQMQVLVSRLRTNPVEAFGAICLFEPSLAANEKYTAEIRAELQKITQG